MIGLHKLDASGARSDTLNFFCEADPAEHSIEVTGLGGDETVRLRSLRFLCGIRAGLRLISDVVKLGHLL